MNHGIVLTYTLTPRWLALTRAERNEMRATHIEPVFARYADRITARFYDAEAFNGRISDFAVLETEDLGSYYFLIEALRDTPLITDGYLVLGEILIGVRDGFQAYERTLGAAPQTGAGA
ncbi:darcynin family protein [Streptomyces sp. NPDC050448]|uniref:darcynin family protein n=1 Tax=Streptomyces sp. NPDC050448 TaxID=3155404 RepID=UPI003417ECFB